MSAGLLKPPTRVRPAALLAARGGLALGPRAEEVLFRGAEVLSEGSVADGSFFGTTLITIDLARVAPELAKPDDDERRRRFLEVLEGSVRIRLHAMRLACRDVARRHPDRALGMANVETRFRLEGNLVFLDVDLEVPVELAARARS